MQNKSHFTTLVPAILLSALPVLILGCKQEPPPIVAAPNIESPGMKASEWKSLSQPEKSDAQALVLLKECLSAHTQGKVERIAELKKIRFTRSGTSRNSDDTWWNSRWTGYMEWPGVSHTNFQILSGSIPQSTAYVRFKDDKCQAGAFLDRLIDQNESSTRDVRMQMHEDFLLYLVMFSEPSIVVTMAKTDESFGAEMINFNVWTPGIEYAQVGFSKSKKLLTRIRYLGRDFGLQRVKDISILGHREIQGITLPERIEITLDGRRAVSLDSLTAEFGPNTTMP